MLKYLIIVLDDTSVSFCHYQNDRKRHNLIGLDDLTSAVSFAMKENLSVQYLFPDYDLPDEYNKVMGMTYYSKIVSHCYNGRADVVVVESWEKLSGIKFDPRTSYVLKTTKNSFFKNYLKIGKLPAEVSRLNVVFTDIGTFTEADFESYRSALDEVGKDIVNKLIKGLAPQLNILTDRFMLDEMNNCNAGWESVTIAPDGRYYICPAFYYDRNGFSVGSLKDGLEIRNSQLYRLDHAPLCRRCDAYQCRRCVWLNRKMTLEVNTPSHEQCVVAHIERNASCDLLSDIRKNGEYLPDKEIKVIDYLDPFDVKDEIN